MTASPPFTVSTKLLKTASGANDKMPLILPFSPEWYRTSSFAFSPPSTPRDLLPFVDWLPHVMIESDPQEGGTGGPIPFDLYLFQIERAKAWATGQSECLLKPRQIGMSWEAAAFAYYTAGFHQANHVALFSAGELEVKQLMSKVAYIHDHLDSAYRAPGKVGVFEATFDQGSTITGYPATKKAGIGTTLALALFDEAGFHAYLRENMGAVVPALGSHGQLIVQSTADPSLGSAGYFHDFYWDSVAGKTTCKAVFLPADIRPGRDAAWFANERKKFPGDDQTFRAFYPFTDVEAFEGKTGLVYGTDHMGIAIFDPKLNVAPAPCSWEDAKWRMLLLDPGGQDPTAIVPLGISGGPSLPERPGGPSSRLPFPYHAHAHGQFYRRGVVSVTEMARYCAEWDSRKRFDYLLYDPAGGAHLGGELARFFGPDRVKPANNDKSARLAAMTQMLRSRRLTYEPGQTEDLVKEFSSYWFVPRSENATGSSSAVQTRTASWHHADGLDAVGYGILALLDGMPASTAARPVKVIGRAPGRAFVRAP